MTVIAAACAGGHVWMASDSELIDGAGRPWFDAHKIVPILVEGHRVALLGHTGLAKAGHRVRRQLSAEGLPAEMATASDDDWADRFSVLVDRWLNDEPDLDKDDEHLESVWLLARAGRLWRVRPGYATPVRYYTAVGSGGDLALGVLFGRLDGRPTLN